jgi:hypothetical protein
MMSKKVFLKMSSSNSLIVKLTWLRHVDFGFFSKINDVTVFPDCPPNENEGEGISSSREKSVPKIKK